MTEQIAVDLKVLGHNFRLATTASQQADLERAAQLLNDKYDEFRRKAPRMEPSKLIIMVALELMQEVDRTVHHMQDEAANFPDPADRASQEEEFSLELRARDRERKLIKKIDETLQLIDDNEYGWCDSCGVEIGIRRLEARPTATLCIDCKTLAEIREKQIGS